MKIKNDFVTNSSSTNMIVAIPPSLTFEQCLSIKEQTGIIDIIGDYGEISIEKLSEIFYKLRDTGMVHEYPNNNEFSVLHSLLSEMNLVIIEDDAGPDRGWIVNAWYDEYQEKLNEIKKKYEKNL